MAALPALLSGCAMFVHKAPVLGRVENGTYFHQSGLFNCPLPDGAYGFKGEVLIEDAALVPIYRQGPDEQGHWALQITGYETVSQPGVKFTDSLDKAVMIEVSPFAPQMVRRHVTDEGELRESIFREGFGGGFAGVLHEERVTDAPHQFAYTVMQVPFYGGELEYMGTNLQQAHLRSQAPPPRVMLVANAVVGRVVYQIRMETSVLPFLGSGINWRDLAAVHQALKANPVLLPLMRKRIFTMLERCELGALMSDGYNPE